MSDDELIDLFGTEPTRPTYPVHVLSVKAVESLDGYGEDWYLLDHGTCEHRGEDCLVESMIRDLGIRGALLGVWSKVETVELRSYRVRGWVTKYPATPNGPEEYDAGIEVVTDDDILVVDSLTAVQDEMVKQTVEQAREEWPEGTEIPFRSDGSMGLPAEGVFVIKHMPNDDKDDDDDADLRSP
jgi:hypothetical protein